MHRETKGNARRKQGNLKKKSLKDQELEWEQHCTQESKKEQSKEQIASRNEPYKLIKVKSQKGTRTMPMLLPLRTLILLINQLSQDGYGILSRPMCH